MNMVEKVARAMEIAAVEKTMHHPVSRFLPKLGWLWPHVARAAIEAMREPSDAMIEAAEKCDIQAEHSPFAERTCWQAMLDAALKETPDGQ